MKAEAALMLGTGGDPKTLLLSGVQKSLDKVSGFNSLLVDPLYVDDDAFIAYVDTVAAMFDTASTPASQMEIIAKEYYIALFGNGVETYNLVRRTAMPSNLQPALEANPGLFYRTLKYPASHVNLNSNAEQKPNNAVQVFWDNNPAGIIQ